MIPKKLQEERPTEYGDIRFEKVRTKDEQETFGGMKSKNIVILSERDTR